MLHLYSAFLGTQFALRRRGISPHPPPMCSIHLNSGAIVRQNSHHTPAYWWRGDRVMKPISVWGRLGGHGGQRPVDRIPALHPYSFSKDILGFLMTTDSQDLGLTSHPKDGAFYSIVSPSLYWGSNIQVLASLTPLPAATQFSQEVSHPGTDQAQPCLASVGKQSWATAWYGYWHVYNIHILYICMYIINIFNI